MADLGPDQQTEPPRRTPSSGSRLAILAAAGVVVAAGFGALAMATSQGNDNVKPADQQVATSEVQTTEGNDPVTLAPSTETKVRTRTATDTETRTNTQTRTNTETRTNTQTQTRTDTNTVTQTRTLPPVTQTVTPPPVTVTETVTETVQPGG